MLPFLLSSTLLGCDARAVELIADLDLVNKQLNDKERVAAALENGSLLSMY